MATPPGPSPSPPSTPTPAAPGPLPPSSPPPAPAAPPSTPTIPPSTPTTPPPTTSPPSTPPPSTPPPSTPPAIPSTPPPSLPPPVTPAAPPSTPTPSQPIPVPPPSTPPVVPVPAPPSGGTPPPAQPPPTPPAQPPATPATPSSPSPPPPKSSPPKKPPVKSPPPAPSVPSPPGETPPPTSPPFNATPPSQPAVPPLSPISPSSPSPPSPADPNPGITPPAPPGAQSPPGSPVPKNPSAASPPNSASPSSPSSNVNTVGLVVGIGVAVVVVGLLVGIIVWFMRKKKRNPEGNGGAYMAYPGNLQSSIASSQVTESPQPKSPSAPLIKTSSSSLAYSPSEGGLGHSRSWFTLEELTEITNGFSPQNLLGEGGFGSVYKGVLSDGREVAVKQLKVGGGQGEREFQAEVEIISRVHHRHLVTLVGYCISDNQRLLVYDYVPNGTLHYHLHGPGRPVLHWATRVKIAVGAARGIAYLHEDCHPRIIHRDIKSSNILLDDSFEARVADFGLAKLTVDAETHVTTRVMGTFGYLAPEYASSGKLTDRSDVYSFGVVLLELITGRKPVDTTRPLGDESLVEWARPLMTHVLETGNLDNIPDVRLQGNYDEMEMFRMIDVAAACVRHSAPMRPRMGLVMRALDNLADTVDLHNGVRPGQSELFNAGANSEEIRIFQRMAFGGPDLSSDYSRSSWMSQRDTGPG